MTGTSIDKKISALLIFIFLFNFSTERGLSVFFLSENGYSISLISSVQVVFTVVVLLAEIPSGFITDRIGSVSGLIAGALLKGGAIAVQLFFVKSHFFIFASSALQAVGYSFISGTVSAYLYHEALKNDSEKDFSRIYSRVGFVSSLSLGIAMITASPISKHFGWSGVYISSTVTSISGGFVLLKYLKSQRVMPPPNKFDIKNIRNFLGTIGSIFPRVVAFGLVDAGMTPYFVYGTRLLHNLGLNQGGASQAVGGLEIAGAAISVYVFRKYVLLSFYWIPALMLVISLSMFSNGFQSSIVAIFALAAANCAALALETKAEEYFNALVTKHNMRNSIISSVSFLDTLFIIAGFKTYGFISQNENDSTALIFFGFLSLCGTFYFLIVNVGLMGKIRNVVVKLRHNI